jgi:toxin ParE1/3/4
LTAKAGGRTATKYDDLFTRLFDLLADFLGIGAPRPVLGTRIRIGIVLPYLVIYQYNERDDTVTIMRIVHGRRNITRVLLRG